MIRDSQMQVRINPAERALLTAAAERNGLSLSSWVRLVLLKAAREDEKAMNHA